MNPLLLTDDVDAGNGVLNVHPNGQNVGEVNPCRYGFFFDKAKSTCRKILCPRHHFIYEGVCHPTFTHTAGQSFYTKVKVPIQQDADDGDDDTDGDHNGFYNRLGLAVVNAILQGSNFVPCDVKGTLRYDSNNAVVALILETIFSTPDGTLYQDVLDMIKPVMSGQFNLKFDGVEYDVNPADDVAFSTDDSGRLVNDNHDEVSELRVITTTKWRYNKTRHCRNPIPFTGVDFCYRMYLKKANVMETMREDYMEEIDADTVALCIEMYDSEFNGDKADEEDPENKNQSDEGVSAGDQNGSGDDDKPGDQGGQGNPNDQGSTDDQYSTDDQDNLAEQGRPGDQDIPGDHWNNPTEKDNQKGTNNNDKDDDKDNNSVVVVVAVIGGVLGLVLMVAIAYRVKQRKLTEMDDLEKGHEHDIAHEDEDKKVVDTITSEQKDEKQRVDQQKQAEQHKPKQQKAEVKITLEQTLKQQNVEVKMTLNHASDQQKAAENNNVDKKSIDKTPDKKAVNKNVVDNDSVDMNALKETLEVEINLQENINAVD